MASGTTIAAAAAPRIAVDDAELMCDELSTDGGWTPTDEVEVVDDAALVAQMTAARRAFPDPVLLNDCRVLSTLLEMDDRHAPSGGYFKYTQTDLQPYMRRMVVGWMHEVCTEQQCEEEVFPMAVNYLDRVLSVVPVKRSQLQLLATACMFIASKFKDTTPLSAHSLVVYTDCSISMDDLMEWEMLVLQALKWDVSCVTPHDFLHHILSRLPLTEVEQQTVRRHAQTFIALCTADFKFVVCPPSLVAAACVSAATTGLMGQTWCNAVRLQTVLRDITSSETDCIRQCQEQIEESLRSSISQSAAAAASTSSLSSSAASSSASSSSIDQGSGSSSTGPKPRSLDNIQPSTPTDVRDIVIADGSK